jgi:hypothetical protein
LLLPRHVPDQLYALLQRLVFNATLADAPRSAHGSSVTCSVEGPCAGGELPLELWLCTVATPLGSARRACVCIGCIAAACSTSTGPGSQRRRGVERSNCNCRSTSFAGELRPRMPRTNDEAAAYHLESGTGGVGIPTAGPRLCDGTRCNRTPWRRDRDLELPFSSQVLCYA